MILADIAPNGTGKTYKTNKKLIQKILKYEDRITKEKESASSDCSDIIDKKASPRKA